MEGTRLRSSTEATCVSPHMTPRRRWPARTAGILLAAAVAAATSWGALLLAYQLPGPGWLRGSAIAAWALLGLLACAACASQGLQRVRRPVLAAHAVILAGLFAWWASLAPSHDRDWADDVARLLEAEVRGDSVVLRNVRNFEWRTEGDYDVRWETRHYDLSKLASADLLMSYWMGPHIAHTLVSFGFEDGSRVVFSLEIRKERHEEFSALGGFFRRFEQVLVASDERDIVRTRSNVRGEDVLLYRLDVPPEALRAMFLGYAAKAGELQQQPGFYNSLTSNCTTIIFEIARHIAPELPLDYRLLLSGHFAKYVHAQGALVPGHAFEALESAAYINPRALRVPADAPDPDAFSRAIRRQVPGVPAEELSQ